MSDNFYDWEEYFEDQASSLISYGDYEDRKAKERTGNYEPNLVDWERSGINDY